MKDYTKVLSPHMTAQAKFRKAPSNKSAGQYLATASKCAAQDDIDDDAFLNAVGEVTYWLLYDKQIG